MMYAVEVWWFGFWTFSAWLLRKIVHVTQWISRKLLDGVMMSFQYRAWAIKRWQKRGLWAPPLDLSDPKNAEKLRNQMAETFENIGKELRDQAGSEEK